MGEIGAGRGRYSVILANHVGDKGHLYANDIDREALDYLDFRCERDGIKNISTIQGQETDPLLPDNTLDMLFIVNSYHHFSHPAELLKNAYPALKSKGTLVIIEGVPGRGWSGHTTSQKDLIEHTEKAGFSFLKVADELEKEPSAEDVRAGQAMSPGWNRSMRRGMGGPYGRGRSGGA